MFVIEEFKPNQMKNLNPVALILVVFPIFYSITSNAQCALTGAFDYTVSNGVVTLEASDLLEDCPNAAYFTYDWNGPINQTTSTNIVQSSSISPGNYTQCVEVTAYSQSGVVLGTNQSCQIMSVSCGQAFGSVSTISATENSVTLALNLISDIDPVAYTWSATAGPFTQPNTPMLTITNPQYPFEGSVVVTVASTCTYAFTFEVLEATPTCDVDFTMYVNENLVTIYETYNGNPIYQNGSPNFSSEYTANGAVVATSHNPSFYLPAVGTYTICNNVVSQGCSNEICHDVTITSVNSNCSASFDYSSSGYDYFFWNTSTGYYTSIGWYVDGVYHSSGEQFYLTLSPDQYTLVEIVVSNEFTDCSDTFGQELMAVENFLVCGYVYQDPNHNYVFDQQDAGVGGIQVTSLFGQEIAITDATGYYEINVFPGDFALEFNSENSSFLFRDSSEEISYIFENSYLIEGCNQNQIVVNTEYSTCGKVFFDANQNTVFDLGEQPLSGAQISFFYTGESGFTEELVAYSNEEGNYCATFTGLYNYAFCTYTLASGDVLTQGINTQNNYIDDAGVIMGNQIPLYFAENAIEVGISISAYSNATPGFEGNYVVTVHNYGSEEADIDFSIQFPNTQEIVGTPQFQGEAGVWNSTTNTLTFSNISISGFSQSSVNINILNSVNSVLGDVIFIVAQASVNNGTDVNFNNNDYTLSQIIIGSYDPNNKLCNPSGQNTDGQMLPTNDPFTYTINFQNTGTAPAYTVRVEDQLDSDLDWSSFEMLYASHAYSVQMQDGYLIWTFNEIMLPDSNSNEPESHGHIVFRIKPIADKPVGTVFENTAYIYFDFNEPIITNTAIITFVSEVGVAEEEEPSLFVRPNPANDFVIVSSDLLNGDAMIRLLDMQGRLVFEQKVTNISQFQLPLSVDAGQYIIQIQNRSNVGASRLVVR